MEKTLKDLLVIMALVVQTGAAFWWGSNLTTRVDALEALNMGRPERMERFVRVEQNVEILARAVERLNGILDKIQRQGSIILDLPPDPTKEASK